MSLVKVIGGMVEIKTYNPVQKSNRLTQEKIIEIAKALGIPNEECKMYKGLGWHHIQNVIIPPLLQV